ncbi:MAG: hypothetical protein HYU46_21680 [Deltaproteobacteria bacterium]|nr:hypothetical protein [Deltaproteobacteria bacterium]MBI2366291.1 hypothetical protein [Deltaproteobacteria bacterium]MBI2534732.1 hypothetical protein [Deltaproteobacteria bacterium]
MAKTSRMIFLVTERPSDARQTGPVTGDGAPIIQGAKDRLRELVATFAE